MLKKLKKILALDIIKVFLFIFSCQVGSGTLILPSILEPYGKWSLISLFMMGLLCSFLAFSFVDTGLNCHEIIGKTFGKFLAKISFWIYWVVSWFSSVVVVKELLAYSGLDISPMWSLFFELSVIIVLTYLSTRGETNMVAIEALVTVLKFLPVIFLIVFYLFSDSSNCHEVPYKELPNIQTALKCLWCFFGVESGSIVAKNFNISRSKRIKGAIFGMLAVMIFYLLSIYIALNLGGEDIRNNPAPYQMIFTKFLGKSVGVTLIRIIAIAVQKHDNFL